jgi:alpha-beta hydrolase superfamily lysophospholipase
MRKVKSKPVSRFLWVLVILFLLMNVVAFFHAYKFTHFTYTAIVKTKDAKQLSLKGKIKTLFFGVDNPHPVNVNLPTEHFETIQLQSNKKLECWLIKVHDPKGTVILFHGYSACKSQMLDKSDAFLKMGYNTLLVDFMGSGGSEGNQTTIGYKEAEEVKTCFDYITGTGEKTIYLFGTSMGSAAVLKAVSDYDLKPKGIIIECPFGSMYKTTCARFRSMGAPTFPMAALLVFWGGVQNGFPAFSHNPIAYSEKVHCPALLLYGGQDEKVSREEIYEIFTNLKGKKQLCVYPLAAHENYLHRYKQQWIKDISSFLSVPRTSTNCTQSYLSSNQQRNYKRFTGTK